MPHYAINKAERYKVSAPSFGYNRSVRCLKREGVRDVRRSVSFSEIRKASPERREQLFSELVEGARAPANGRIEEIDARIARFERTHGVSSEDMIRELDEGKRRETEEISSWLMLLNLRERAGVH